MLAKYHSLPNHFYDLKTSLNADFAYLKTATIKNTQNLLDIIKQQETYTNALGQHINTLHAKLVWVEQQVQIHCLYPHANTDEVQLEAPLYDPDIDGQINTHQDTTEPKEVYSSPATPTPESLDHTTYGPEPVPTALPESNTTNQEIEEGDEDWEYGEFDDIDFNNTKEAYHIRCDYSPQFLHGSAEDTHHHQTSPQNPKSKTVYYLLELEYYNSDTRPWPGTMY